tara:strand:+ start:328 stop:498 length:171 start_codon:yes stop_codon:yes gene_type:complete
MMARKTDPSKTSQQIDENLKRVYDDALQEKLPERFLDLIRRLKDADNARRQDDDDG